MRINYAAVSEEARRKGIPASRIIKDLILYRKAYEQEKIEGRCCRRCMNRIKSPWSGNWDLCEVIGINSAPESRVDPDSVCEKIK